MNRFVTIPREQLEQLLRDAGNPQSVEEFLAQGSVQSAIESHDLYQKRATAAKWSRIWLLASALFSMGSFFVSPNLEDGLSGIILMGMTVLEFKVHDWFLHSDPRGPLWGYRNQSLFALFFLVYGFYHVFVPTPLKEIEGMRMEELGFGDLTGTIHKLEQLFYVIVGLVGAGGQYLLARYYRKASRPAHDSLGRTSS
jgi:hypothetical protein